MIAHLQRASSTTGLLTYLYGPGDRADHSNPRLIAGDCHGAPIEMLAQPDALPYLAQAVDAPLGRLGLVPPQPTWHCSIRSDPRLPDLSDSQWSQVARRIVSVSGIAPDGDPDGCRWIAIRNSPRVVHLVASLAREDGRSPSTYRAAFNIHAECRRMAAEFGHLPTAHVPPPRAPEAAMPITVTITSEPSGSVVVRGGDSLAASLLTHAGFAFVNDWHGARHRLPTTMPFGEQAAIATHAAEMLRAARYTVDLAPGLDTNRLTTPTDPHGLHVVGGQVLSLTDRINGASDAAQTARAVDQLINPTDGVLIRLQEALESAAEKVTDLDDDAYELADRFTAASEHLTAATEELKGTTEELRDLDGSSHLQGSNYQAETASYYATAVTSAALATSPVVAKASASVGSTALTSTTPASARPVQGAGPRAR